MNSWLAALMIWSALMSTFIAVCVAIDWLQELRGHR